MKDSSPSNGLDLFFEMALGDFQIYLDAIAAGWPFDLSRGRKSQQNFKSLFREASNSSYCTSGCKFT